MIGTEENLIIALQSLKWSVAHNLDSIVDTRNHAIDDCIDEIKKYFSPQPKLSEDTSLPHCSDCVWYNEWCCTMNCSTSFGNRKIMP